jgi:hypothetical protein
MMFCEVLLLQVNFISNAYNNTLAERFLLVAKRHDRVRDVIDTAFIALDENTLVAEAAKALYAQERCTIVVTHLDIDNGSGSKPRTIQGYVKGYNERTNYYYR